MALANTIWPPDLPVPSSLKTWLAELFATVDSKAPDSGEKLATLYSPNAVVYGMYGRSEGSQAIAESRKSAWDNFTSRQHELLRVYAGKSDYSEVLLIGKLTALLKNNNTVVTEFIAQVQFDGDMQKPWKGTLSKVWGDSAP